VSVTNLSRNSALVVGMPSTDSSNNSFRHGPYRIHVMGQWVDALPLVGSIFNLLLLTKSGENEVQNNKIIVVNSVARPFSAIIITHPDILVSATNIAEASPCLRKAVISAVYSPVRKALLNFLCWS
jgi:hypothetical protein